MQASIAIRPMMEADIDMINCEFKENGIGTSKAYHKKCWNMTKEKAEECLKK